MVVVEASHSAFFQQGIFLIGNNSKDFSDYHYQENDISNSKKFIRNVLKESPENR
ncbi:MAG TPA: hypothetical protein VH500_05200 [Nitrososphaeraceae archaeon]